MVLKAAVVFIAGGLTGSGIVALTRAVDESGPATSVSNVGAPISEARAAREFQTPWLDPSQISHQDSYIQASFAAQRPFAALHPPKR